MALAERINRAAYEKLQRENERLKALLAEARERGERSEAEIGRLAPIVRAVLDAQLGRIVESLGSLRQSLERNGSRMSEQLTQLNTTLDEVVGVVGNLTQSVQNESQQLAALLERLNSQTQLDLTPAIQKARDIGNALSTANQQIQSLVAEEPAPEPPPPTPEPGPEPAPGRGR